MKRFTCSIVQFDTRVGLPDESSLARMTDAIETANADLVVFPELATTGYNIFDDLSSVAEPVPGPTTEVLGEVAADSATEVLYGMPVMDNGTFYNSAVWLGADGEIRARYDKRHLWGDERDAFVPGNQYVAVETPFARVGIQICYDLNYPEASAAIARAECDVVINIAAWSVRLERDWHTVLPARALEHGAYVIGCNRAGIENGNSFCGRSTIIEPDGTSIIEMGNRPGQVSATLDPGVVAAERSRNPMHKDRPDNVPNIMVKQ